MIFQTLVISFIVSYMGSIPPGTINVSVMQLSILKKHRAAIFLAFASAAIEFIYAGITVKFHIFLNANEFLGNYFYMITSVTLIVLGFWNIFFVRTSPSKEDTKIKGRHGLYKGIILGILNPLTIPFWLPITIYLENNGWIELTDFGFWIYLIGISSGTFCLLLTVNFLGKKFGKILTNRTAVNRFAGFLLLGLGIYLLVKFILNY